MKISFIIIGKTSENYLKEGIQVYKKRIQRYLPFDIKVLPNIKNSKKLSTALIKEKEGEVLLKQFAAQDFVILLDENGRQYSSVQFAKYWQSVLNKSSGQIKFVCGGAYGFSDAVYRRANAQLSLSPMTFSHQLVRLVFVEQLYRAFTILHNEPYHHA